MKTEARSRAAPDARPGTTPTQVSGENFLHLWTRASSALATELLLAKSAEYLLGSGSSREELAQAFSEKAAALRAGKSVRAPLSRNYERVHAVSGVIHDWEQDPLFIEADGSPRALPLTGTNSLQTLLARRMAAEEIAETIDWLCQAQLIKETDAGLYKPQGRAVLIQGGNGLSTERGAAVAMEFLDTMMHNRRTPLHPDQNFDRVAQVRLLAQKHLPRFRKFLTAQGQSFLEVVDDWMESHQSLDPNVPTARVGVHVFLHTLDNPVRRRGSTGKRGTLS
jgi:hypothetical protein